MTNDSHKTRIYLHLTDSGHWHWVYVFDGHQIGESSRGHRDQSRTIQDLERVTGGTFTDHGAWCELTRKDGEPPIEVKVTE